MVGMDGVVFVVGVDGVVELVGLVGVVLVWFGGKERSKSKSREKSGSENTVK